MIKYNKNIKYNRNDNKYSDNKMSNKMNKEKVYLKLNDNYSNAFLTTNHGEVFYKDWLKQNRPEYVEVDKDAYEKSFELREFVRMKMLILKEAHKQPPVAEGVELKEQKKQAKSEETIEDIDNSLLESAIVLKN